MSSKPPTSEWRKQYYLDNRDKILERANSYVKQYDPERGLSRTEHVLIAERVLGRALKPGEVVHHVNDDGSDNRHENLVICKQDYHKLLHQRMRAMEECGNPSWRKCPHCKTYDDPDNMLAKRNNGSDISHYMHHLCELKYDAEYLKRNKLTEDQKRQRREYYAANKERLKAERKAKYDRSK